MDLNDALDFGDVVPLQELLSWGPSLWDDEEEEEFVPNADEKEEDENNDDKEEKETFPAKKKSTTRNDKKLKRIEREDVDEEEEEEEEEGKNELLEEADEELYKQLLAKNELFDDVEDDDDSYDFLADVDGNAELIRKDREDELEVGNADGDDLAYLNDEGGASFVALAKSKVAKRRKKNKEPLSSPAKGTRAATASFRFKHPVLSMNVPAAVVEMRAEEPTQLQMSKIQEQLDVLQQFLLEGLGLANASKNSDLIALYQSIILEMEVQYTMTGFSLKLLEAASGLSTMSEISAALSGLIKAEYSPPAELTTPAKAQKGSNAFFGPAIDELLIWGLGRIYKPNSYDGEALLFGRVTETYFPLFGSSALNRRYQNKLKLASKENPIKLFAKRLRARVAWSDEEDVQLLLWTRRHPQDVTFEEAEKRPLESGVRLRFAAGMQARRAELLAILPSRADEDAFLRAHKINLPEEHEEENLDVKFFDVEEIDSMSDEDLGLVGPPHPRSVSPERWPEEHDRQLLRAFATWLKRDNLPLDARARSELMSSTGHDAKDVEQRCELWRNAYHPYKGKPRKKKQ